MIPTEPNGVINDQNSCAEAANQGQIICDHCGHSPCDAILFSDESRTRRIKRDALLYPSRGAQSAGRRLHVQVDCIRVADNPPGGDGKHYAVLVVPS